MLVDVGLPLWDGGRAGREGTGLGCDAAARPQGPRSSSHAHLLRSKEEGLAGSQVASPRTILGVLSFGGGPLFSVCDLLDRREFLKQVLSENDQVLNIDNAVT